ncbi:hypothetical protein EUGRSUZ_C00625 [Eucalyptus grandis]|uniref:Uncharacterized protein n=2 Tax=Eucalyptus grandis TaxID=71139 RepID=A0ACC3LAA4_EUCGR|nr:hypothetical protein EUGRSUZ_C00625 [Eucalyptus grandis]
MAEEEVVALSPPPPDHKRKLDDSEEAGAPEPAGEADSGDIAHAAGSDSLDAKRPRLDEVPEVSVHVNGYQDDERDEPVEEENKGTAANNGGAEGLEEQPDESVEVADDEKAASENHEAKDVNTESQDNLQGTLKEEAVPSADVTQQDASAQQLQVSDDGHTLTCKIEVPNNKVGVLIGKAGETIRYLQYNSGAKIQIVRDAEADMSSTTRPVELTGTSDSIHKAEKLIRDVIAEADAGGSPALVARGIATAYATTGPAEQIELKVPNDKVGLVIGRGGDTIKGLQTRSGARIQLIPQHLPEGDESKERIVRVSGDRRQIEVATEMIKEVMRQTPRPSPLSGGFSQNAYRSRGPSASSWGSRAPHPGHMMSYDYHQRGPHISQNAQYPPPSYGGYPPPRSGFNSGWEQRPSSMQGPPHSGSYGFYGAHGGNQAGIPHSGPNAGQSAGPPQSQASYNNYGQPQGPNYGHPGPYPQAGNPQQSYAHGYNETGYNNPPVQHSYGGQSSQPVYTQAAAVQPGYAQQYGPGGHPQSYGTPGANQPGNTPYPGSSQSTQQTYSSSVPSQQTYAYPASGPMQQTYQAYGSAPASDGFNQPLPASGAVYPQQGQATSGYGQPAAAGAYGSYPEQPVTANASYGYQVPQDAALGGGPGGVYAAPPSSQTQPGYAQQPTTQPGYDQSVAQPGSYGNVPANAQAGYGKSLSPQPGYPQYDSAQVYGPR